MKKRWKKKKKSKISRKGEEEEEEKEEEEEEEEEEEDRSSVFLSVFSFFKFNFLFRDESNSTLKQKPNICIVRTTKTCVHTNTFMLWTRRFLSMCEGSKQLISTNKSKLLKTEKEPVKLNYTGR